MTTTTGAIVDQPQDLFTFSYGTDQDVIFDRDTEYTAQRMLEEVADLIVHPDNKHINFVEVRRVCRIRNAVKPELKPVSLADSNTSSGWCGEVWTASAYQSRHFCIARPEVLADKLVKLLGDRATEWFILGW